MNTTMNTTLEIPVTQATISRIKEVDFKKLEFGKHIGDHMFMADYANGEWQDPKIIPYGNLSMSPAILALHYGQSVFEGMKAFRMKDGSISIFRMDKHWDRMNKSLHRMCMPALPEDLFVSAIHKLVELDREWVPKEKDSALYLRPIVFATEQRLGVKVSEQYKFMVLSSPVGPYYAKPLRVKVETEYVRAAEGGTGYAKCAGNYGGSFYPAQLARKQGFDQVLWTDSKEHLYFDEAGTMNLFFVSGDTLLTPPLSTTILDGVTRASVIQIARDFGMKVEERRVSIKEIKEGIQKGTVTEVFGAGTAAVVAPIKTVNVDGTDYELPEPNEKSFMMRAKKQIGDIRSGAAPDVHGWNYVV